MSTRGVFFGWWVALSFAVMAFLSSGIRFAVDPFLKVHRTHLGSLNGFLADIKRVDEIAG